MIDFIYKLTPKALAGSLDDLNPTPFEGAGGAGFNNLVNSLANRAIYIFGALAIIAIIIAGAQYVFAFGDPAKTAGAKKSLMWTLSGIAVISLFGLVLTVIRKILSIGIL